jgi:hypothetical protein
VVYALLALNLGLLTWNLQGEATAPDTGSRADPAAVPVKEEMDALPLLSELEQPGLRSRPTQLAAAAAAEVASAADSKPATPSPESPAPEPKSAAAAAATTTIPTAKPEVVPAPASKPKEAAPETVKSPAQPEEPASAVAEAATLRVALSCMTLGPLEDKTAIPEIQAWLEQRGARVDVRVDERREVALYWVFFPPRESRAVAVEEVVRMKAQGIEDIIVVPKGDMANAISLGVFSRPESRDRRLKELNGKGYQPSIGPRYRTKVASWMDVTLGAQEGQSALDRGAVESRWPKVRITTGPCSGEAAQAAPARASVAAAGNVAGQGEKKPRRFHFSGPARKP